jgi:putative oxidoreductase
MILGLNSLIARLQKLSFLSQLLIRLVIASVFIHSGYGKLTHLDKTIEYFASLGIPMAHLQAPFAAGMELLCGSLVLIGFATRVAAVPLIVIMAVAIRTARWEDVDGIMSLADITEFLYIVLLSVLVFNGAGKLSVDGLFGSRRNV